PRMLTSVRDASRARNTRAGAVRAGLGSILGLSRFCQGLEARQAAGHVLLEPLLYAVAEERPGEERQLAFVGPGDHRRAGFLVVGDRASRVRRFDVDPRHEPDAR